MDGTAIKSALDALSPGGILELVPGSALQSPRIDALVTKAFGGTLTATLGEATVGATEVSYAAAQLASAGFLFYPRAASLAATLIFSTGSDGALDCTLAASMPNGWTLAASFPDVGKLAHSALNDLSFSAATITVASATDPATALIGATIDSAASAIADFEFLLGASCQLSGPASFVAAGGGGTAPSFSLSTQAIDGPKVSGFSFAISLNLRAAPSPAPAPDGSTPLVGSVDLTTALITPALTLPVVIGVTGKGQGSYTIALDPSAPTPQITSLDQLAGFTFGGSPASLLQAAQTPVGTLSLDYVFATLDTRARTLSNLQVLISLGTCWTVVDGLFKLEKLSAAVVVPVLWSGGSSPPGGGSGFSLTVSADFMVGVAPLEAAVTYPDLTLSLGLQTGSVIDIGSFISRFAPAVTLPGSTNAMSITTLSAVADITNKRYSLSAAASGSLTLIPKFTLTEIDLAIVYANKAVESFDFGCHFTIANAPLALSVSYGSSNWALQGSTEPGQAINLSELVADILTIFQVTLPTNLPAIVLEQLSMSYATGTGAFGFDAAIAYVNESDPILRKIEGTVSIAYQGTASGKWTGDVKGSIEVGSNLFTIELDFAAATVLSMQWNAESGSSVGIADLCGLVGITPPSIPEGLDLALIEIDGSYDITNQVLMLGAQSHRGAAELVVWNDKTNGWSVYFGLATNLSISLSSLPMVGTALAKFGEVSLSNIQADVAVPLLSAAQAKVLAGEIKPPYPSPKGGLPNGVALSMDFTAGGSVTPISIGTSATASTPSFLQLAANTAPDPGGPPAAPTSDGTKWFNVQKSFGPVSIQKVGVRYSTSDSRLWALMNASLSVGGLEIGLLGLGAGSPLDTFKPKFTASGVTVSLQDGPVAFSGGLVGSIDPVNLYGELALAMGPFALGALGGYATYQGDPSFFLYAVLDAPLGGPSFFFVTGLAAGFGFNRQLLVPDVSGVPAFPLVAWATGVNAPSSTASGDVGQQLENAMATLTQSGVIAPAIGEYWMAAGVHFTSFELVDTFALVTVSFGKSFELDILGLSTLSLPPDEPVPLAVAQLALKASFAPSLGLISVAGQLTNASYVLSKDCHLTGGFAFYLWYAGEHAGEFVLSLGGYSPNFTKPIYYPAVPRLGLNWKVTDNLTISGDEYFALTSSAVMAGGGLSAVWQSGSLRAWFDVQADFLLVFQPLHYYISASIDLGASVSIDLWFTTLRITIHVGVGAEIWGPSFSGEVRVDLSIVSFTIGFGDAARRGQTSVDWGTFTGQLLPPPPAAGPTPRRAMLATTAAAASSVADALVPAVLQINATTGIVKTLDASTGLDWLVDGHSFQLAVVSAIPIKTYTFTNGGNATLVLAPAAMQPQANGQPIQPTTDFGVGPTGTDSGSFTSELALTVTSTEDSAFDAVMQLQSVSKALWEKREFDGNGVPQNVDPMNGTTIPNVLSGFALIPTVPPPDHTLPIALENLKYTIDPAIQSLAWSEPVVQTSDPFTTEQVASTIGTPSVTANRTALIAAIQRAGFGVSTAVDVSTLADPATNYLLAPPALRYLGEAR